MEQKIYYVASAAAGEIFNPIIMEKFNSRAYADSYAALMCRVKHKKYIVLEQITEWDGTPQEK